MPIQSGSSDQIQREKRPQKKALVDAINKYFKTSPSREKPATANMETSIINALRRYFGEK